MFQHKFCQVASVQVGRAVPQKVQQMRQKEGGGGGQEWQLLCLISAFTTPPSTCKSFPLRNATTLQWRISMMPKLTLSKGPTGGSKEWLQPSPQLTWHHLTLKLNAGVGGWAHLQCGPCRAQKVSEVLAMRCTWFPYNAIIYFYTSNLCFGVKVLTNEDTFKGPMHNHLRQTVEIYNGLTILT